TAGGMLQSSARIFRLSTPLFLHSHRERHPLHSLRRILLQFAQDDLYGALQLGIAAGNYLGRSLLDFDVRRHPFVLDAEALLGPKAEVRGRDAAAVHQHGEAEDADEAAPGALADKGAELVLAEHPRQKIATGPGRFVDE